MPSHPHPKRIAGLLLTGGQSRRMGFDKAGIRIDGVALAVRSGRLLAEVTDPALEVGPGRSGLEALTEPRPGAGPLVALAGGASALVRRGWPGPALLIATDLPRLDAATLTRLRDWPGGHSVVPRIEGRPQPLCARWSATALAAAVELAAAGERRLGALLELADVELTDTLDPRALADADDPASLDAMDLDWRAP